MLLSWVSTIEGNHRHTLYELYSKEWWTKHRTPEQLDKMLDGSDILVGCCDKSNNLIGFARILTDFTFKALIFDVIVSEKARGEGIGSAIIKHILTLKELEPVGSFELYCPDRLVPYYQQFGFEQGTANLLFLER